MLGVLSSTDLLTGTLDLGRGLLELAQKAEEFFMETCFSLGEDPTPVRGKELGGEVRRTKNKTEKKLKQLPLLHICLQKEVFMYTKKYMQRRRN